MTEPTPDGPYRVLARKYRPTTFAELIGQQAMVRTLTNAMASGRLAHAFILTGVRGIGKTTTARLIARALNCTGPDGTDGPTVAPCGVCENCTAIAEDRHVDVMEMDAASRTGVDDIREIIDGVRYRPTSARFKVYIIDEVHMLSRNAFNALLKTLEEPPEHVKFIFATTEIRKVPVTVLSRCQRFDLRRVDQDTLAAHFGAIAEKEGARVSAPALHLIARAADGSVRDGLSLLDQAIAHGGGEVGEDAVRGMLGLADRTVTFDLLDAVMKGDIAAALDRADEQYGGGADPAVVLEDMLELVHWLTRIRIAPGVADGPGVPEAERVRGRAMAQGLGMAALTRAWQMLLKGLAEVRAAPSPIQAAEMVLIRLAYAAELPSPVDAVKALGDGGGRGTAAAGGAPSGGPASGGPASGGPALALARSQAAPAPQAEPRAAADPEPGRGKPDPADFRAVVDLAATCKEGILHAHLLNDVHLVRFDRGHVEFHPGPNALPDLANRLKRFLDAETARRWVVMVSSRGGEATLAEQDRDQERERLADAAREPLVQAVMDAFPGARILDARALAAPDTAPLAPGDAPESGETESDEAGDSGDDE